MNRLTLVLAIAAIVVACDEVRSPSALPNTMQHDALAGGGTLPPLFDNANKYADSSVPPAVGRSGSASLQVRALANKTGRTLVEMTTGSFDAPPWEYPPGQIDKVQFKTFDPNGVELTTTNSNNVNRWGWYSENVFTLGRGAAVQVQANVSNIDAHRTDIVTVVAPVRLLPDLAVTSIAAPAMASSGAYVTISATVRELNGDLGAWTPCLLYVNGAFADYIRSMWVNAGGTVTCSFLTRLTGSGEKRIRVEVSSGPNEYDDSNNAAETVVTIPPNDFNWTASASEVTVSDVEYYRWSWTYGPDQKGVTGESHGVNNHANVGSYQTGDQVGDMSHPISFPIARVHVTHASAGQTLLDYSYDNLTPTFALPGQPAMQCALRVVDQLNADIRNVWVQVCSSGFAAHFEEHRWAGDVTYFSERFNYTWFLNPDGTSACGAYSCFATNTTTGYVRTSGLPLIPLGNDYVMTTEITSGANTYVSNSFIQLPQAQHVGYVTPPTCFTNNFGYYRQNICEEGHLDVLQRSGSATGTANR